MTREHPSDAASRPDPIAIYLATVEEVYAFIARRCAGERQTAEDLTQETYLRFMAECRKGRTPAAPAAWLRVVAHNVLMTHYRKRRPVSADPAAMDAVLASPGRNRLEHPETVASVMWGLAGIRAGWAALLASYHLDGRSVAEIAVECRMSERAVEGQLRRARLALKKRLEHASKEVVR